MDDQKNKILIAVIAFNIAIMVYLGYQSMANGLDNVSFVQFVVAFLLASVAGGAAFAVASALKK